MPRQVTSQCDRGQSPAPSKYKFIELPNGFAVEAPDRHAMIARQTRTGFEVHRWQRRQLNLFDRSDFAGLNAAPTTNLLEYRKLVKLIAEGLMEDWLPPNLVVPPWHVKEAAVARTRQAIGRRVHEQWKRLVSASDSEVLRVQKAVFSTGCFNSPSLHVPELYRKKFLVRDVQQYRAAASIVAAGEQIYDAHLERSDPESYYSGDPEPINGAAMIEYLSDWQSLCSPTGKPSGSLRRTLMRLPGGIPASLLINLQGIDLERTITDRVELATLLLAAASFTADEGRDRPGLRHRFMHASRAEIIESMQLLAQHLGYGGSSRRVRDIRNFVTYICDFPEDHRGKLTTFTRRAIEWHRQFANVDPWEYEPETGADQAMPAARPSIPLPEESGIRFLDSVEAICNEGREMHHCIASYARSAVSGRSFLFSVIHNGERASAEVVASGQVRQCYGPANQLNAATEYGVRVLTQWGKKMAGKT